MTGGVGEEAVLALCDRTVSAKDDVDFQTLSRFFCSNLYMHSQINLVYNPSR